jgi:hypothetical protein
MKKRRILALGLAVVGFAILGVALAGWTGTAYADDSIFWLTPTVTNVSSGVWQWSYPISIDTNEHINTSQNASFTTLYDFYGLTGTPSFTSNSSISTLSGTLTTPFLGATPSTILVADNPSIINLSVAFSGMAPTATGGDSCDGISGQLCLGTVVADSTVGSPTLGFFSGQATLNSSNAPSSNESQQLEPTPEPGSLVLLGLALPIVGETIRRRIRR